MKSKTPISVVIVIAFGLVILAGYFVDLPLLVTLRNIFLRWTVALAAVALLVGVVNLFIIHWRKAVSGEKGGLYSAVVLLSMVTTLGVVGFFGPSHTWSLWLYKNIQVPVETSLMAILAVVLVYAIARLMRRGASLFSLVFAFTVLVMLLGAAPLAGIELPGLQGPDGIRALIAQIPAVAGARGILLGVALGIIATGLRVLIGSDRPYGG